MVITLSVIICATVITLLVITCVTAITLLVIYCVTVITLLVIYFCNGDYSLGDLCNCVYFLGDHLHNCAYSLGDLLAQLFTLLVIACITVSPRE